MRGIAAGSRRGLQARRVPTGNELGQMTAIQPSVPVTEQPSVTTEAAADDATRANAPSARVALAGLAWTLVRTDFKARYTGRSADSPGRC